MKNSLTVNAGLSLSQAQSVSNLCNQRAREIDNQINGVNNCSKSVEIYRDGSSKMHQTVVGKPLPIDVVSLLKEKAKLHACQAFLMENMKAKESMLKQVKMECADISSVPVVPQPKLIQYKVLPNVDETFGWSQLSVAEYNEYLEEEAYASHIGQFIHKGGTLDNLRNELPNIPAIEWMNIKDGEKSPVIITTHHNAETLHKLHEELAALHRQHEQRVNYFKAKVKNLTTVENARIAKVNADEQSNAETINKNLSAEYTNQVKAYNESIKSLQADFEKERQDKIKEIAAMRIKVDQRFQDVVNGFLKGIPEVQE